MNVESNIDPLWSDYQILHQLNPSPSSPEKIDYYGKNSSSLKPLLNENNPTRSIIIAAYNEQVLLPRILASVNRAVSRSSDSQLEVIVVDNNSNDATKDICTEFGVKRVFEPIKGIAQARQAGLESASNKSQIVLTTDADCVIPPNWINNLTHKMDNPDIVMACGLTKYENDFIDQGLGIYLLACINYLALVNRKIKGLNNHTYFATSGNLVFNKSSALKVGGYDNRLSRGEDHDLMKKLLNLGEVITFNDSVVLNSSRRISGEGFIKNIFTRIYQNIHFYLTGDGMMGTEYKDYRNK